MVVDGDTTLGADWDRDQIGEHLTPAEVQVCHHGERPAFGEHGEEARPARVHHGDIQHGRRNARRWHAPHAGDLHVEHPARAQRPTGVGVARVRPCVGDARGRERDIGAGARRRDVRRRLRLLCGRRCCARDGEGGNGQRQGQSGGEGRCDEEARSHRNARPIPHLAQPTHRPRTTESPGPPKRTGAFKV